MNLQLSLKKKWFEMTKAGIKTEDYREITHYWITRLVDWSNYPKETPNDCKNIAEDILFDFNNGHDFIEILKSYYSYLKPFTTNTMTLGYPKSGDTERILKLEHKGIEIREGNPEWGAEPGKKYFIIKHGKQL